MEPKVQKIVSLQAENVKRLVAVEITPSGDIVVVGGRNGQGKSSVLDSIIMAIGGKDEVPTMPLRKGADRGKVVLTTPDFVIERTFAASGGTSLVIKNRDGLKYTSPQAILDGLTGKVCFDPMAFIRLEGKKQSEQLRKLVGLDFSKLDADRKHTYDERTLVNRDVANAEAQLSAMPLRENVPAERVSIEEIQAKISSAEKHNDSVISLDAEAHIAEGRAKTSSEVVARIEQEVKYFEDELAKKRSLLESERAECVLRKEDARRARESADAAVAIDIAGLRKDLIQAQAINAIISANEDREKAKARVAEIKKKSESLTGAIEAIDAEKSKLLSEAKFPVVGLSFDENGILFNGIPFSQASGAEQIRVSVAMACALNPTLRVMIVKDGSLLDSDSLKLLFDLAKEHDVQVWLERVGSDENTSVVIEDGRVAEPEAA